MRSTRHRLLEEALFVLAGLVAALYVLGVEVFPHVCYSTGLCPNPPKERGFPWGVVILCFFLVLPKTLGRVTAGKVWEAIAQRLSSGGG